MKLLSLLMFCVPLWSWHTNDSWKHTLRASQRCVIRGVPAVTYRKAWPLLPSSVRGCSRQADGYDHRTTAPLTIAMIQAQMDVESRGDWGAISREGCRGSMQVHPITAKDYGIPVWTLSHPVLSLQAGITIMSKLWSRWSFVTNWKDHWSLVLSSYNAGYTRTNAAYHRLGKRWMDGVPQETRTYVNKILNRYWRTK
jgi:hypothetical protein